MSRTQQNREFEGENLEQALEKAAKALEVNEAELDYEILEQGRRGLWGIGHKSVRIRVMPPIQPVDADHSELTTDAITGGRSRSRRGRGRGQGRGGQGRGGQAQDRGGQDRGGQDRGGQDRGGQDRGGQDRGGQGRGGQDRGGQDRGGQGQGGARGADAQGRGRGDRGNRDQGEGNREEGQTGRRRRRRSRGGSGRHGSAARRPRGDGQRPKRVDRPDVSPEEAAKVQVGLQKIVDLMGLEVRAEPVEVTSTVVLELKGADEEFLTGKDSELLSSLEFLLNRMSRRSWPEATRIHLGSIGHRTERDEEVVELVKEVAQQVIQTGESKRLHAMNSYERRLAHLTVRGYSELGSRSEGEGPVKKVRIYKKRGAEEASEELPQEAPEETPEESSVSEESDAQSAPEMPEEQEKSDS